MAARLAPLGALGAQEVRDGSEVADEPRVVGLRKPLRCGAGAFPARGAEPRDGLFGGARGGDLEPFESRLGFAHDGTAAFGFLVPETAPRVETHDA